MKDIAQVLAELRASAHIDMDVCLEQLVPKKRKLHRIVQRMLREGHDLAMVLDLLEGRAFLTTVKGESYVFRRDGERWIVGEHSIVDGRCSCEDSRYRGRPCKHMVALEMLR